MQITVFGASGKVGSLVVEEALRRGYKVTAFVHSRNLFAPNGNLGVQKGDIYNAADVAKALKSSEAVVSCLGSWGTPGHDVLASATRNIIPAMHEKSIKRVVTLTGTGVAVPGKPAGAVHKLGLKLLAPFPAGKVFYDGEEHLRLLAASDLNWTTILSPVMKGGSSAAYKLSSKANPPLINRSAVASALLDQLEATDFMRRTAVISPK